MPVKVYVIDDPLAIDFIVNDDIEGFTENLAADEYLDFGDPEVFATEEEANAFCSCLGYNTDERAIPDCFPLRSSEPSDAPFIDAIERDC